MLTLQMYQNLTSGDEGVAQSVPVTTHGQISEFHGGTEDWPLYVEWLECYFAASDVEESRK